MAPGILTVRDGAGRASGLCIAAVVTCLGWPAAAQNPAAAASQEVPPVDVPSPLPPRRPQLGPSEALRARALGREIRCPVCQGMPVGESPATMARDMQARLEGLVAEGHSDDEVRAWFVQRYGGWVLLDPPRRGMTLVLFILPVVFGAVAATLAWRTWRRLSAGAAVAAPAAAGPDGTLRRLPDEMNR